MRAVLIVVTIAILVITGAALALGWEGALTRRRDPVTVDAYVAGDRTPLSSHLSGYVRTVLVRDNQLVRAGDTIVQMVDDDYHAIAAEAQAQADAARAALAALEEKREVLQQQVVEAQDAVTAAADQLVHAVNEVHRQEELLPTASGLLQSLQGRGGVPGPLGRPHTGAGSQGPPRGSGYHRGAVARSAGVPGDPALLCDEPDAAHHHQ